MTIQNEALNWHFPAGSTASGREVVRITPEVAHWGYSGLRVLDLAKADTYLGNTGGDEMIVLPLTGSCTSASTGICACGDTKPVSLACAVAIIPERSLRS